MYCSNLLRNLRHDTRVMLVRTSQKNTEMRFCMHPLYADVMCVLTKWTFPLPFCLSGNPRDEG